MEAYKVTGQLRKRQGLRSGHLIDHRGSLQLLNSSHIMERDEALLRSVMAGGV